MDKPSGRGAAIGLAFSLALAVAPAQAQVVISQVYGGGGNSGAPLRSDFIELHNNSTASVSIDGWSVQYASSTGTSWQRTNLAGTIPAGGYYLVKQADGSNTAATPLPAPDASGSIAMSGTAGKVALVDHQVTLSGVCPTGSVDFVGFGGANCAEGSAPTPALSNGTAALRADGGCTDSNNNAADFAVGAPAPRNGAAPAHVCGNSQPILSVADASADEAAGRIVFTLVLNQPAGAGGASVAWTTADGSAQAGSDYAAASGTATFAEGAASATVEVAIIDDGVTEPDEAFFLDLSDASGLLIGDAQAQGTIVNDDVTLTAIHAIQGNGARSPLDGQFVYTTGIVTGRKNNGFFLQAPDSEADADPATSEGVFVFTSVAPPAAAAVGNRVRVGGTVIEYVPTADPYQLPLTEITGNPSVTLLDEGNPLPVPVAVTAELTRPDGGFGQLEHLEGMRVSVASLTTVAATEGNATPFNATGSANGIIYSVVTGLPRPFREPGLQLPDPIPGGAEGQPIPRWDGNPEILTVDSDTLGGPAYLLDLPAGSVIEGLTGPLDYGFRRYTVHRDPQAAVNVIPAAGPRAARTPEEREFTVAAANLERFYDNINDANVDDSVASATAYQTRLKKASLAVRDSLHAPDVLVAIEVEKLAVLQALAERINADAVAAGQPDPQYAAWLEEGNDVGGIDVGFLVKTADAGGAPRVEVLSIAQIGKDATWTQPDGTPGTLNDRPPLQLDAVVHYADGRRFPLTVVGVHQRSLIDAELDTPTADRVRKKRQAQAEFLAAHLQQLQTAAPDTRLVVLGDFNAFAFNDGLGDIMGTTSGTPSPNEQTVVPGDGADLVNPDLVNLGELAPAGERYSFVFDGNAQTLDHVLVNEELVVATRSAEIDHARINADFSDSARGDASTPVRTADHDPVIAYFAPRNIADLAVTASAANAETIVGQPLVYAASVANLGPEAAEDVGVGVALDAELADMAVAAPAGWSCDAPQIADGRTSVACFAARLANGDGAGFTVTATAARAGAALLAVAADAQSLDRNGGNDQAEAAIAVNPAPTTADLALTLACPAEVRHSETRVACIATLRNDGAAGAAAAWVEFGANTLIGNSGITAPAGWSCALVGRKQDGALRCAAAQPLAPGAQAVFAIELFARPMPKDRIVVLRGSVGSATAESAMGNNAGQAAIRLY